MHLIGNELIEINFENDDRIEEFLRELRLEKDATGDLSDYVLVSYLISIINCAFFMLDLEFNLNRLKFERCTRKF